MTATYIRNAVSLSGLAAVLAFAPAPAYAQAGEGDAADSDVIIVTAQRREEASVDVPISVTTLGAEQLAVANVNQLSDTAKLTPGLRFDTQGAAMQPTIRGVGTAITTSGGGPNVGIYVDGFFQPNTYSSNLQLMKAQSIQVLKGPQGTLFGRNTTGGAILVTTADPSTETSAEAKVRYGRFNEMSAQAYATFGISERVALDIEGLYRHGDGFQRSVVTGEKLGKHENWSVRLGLKAELTDSTSVLLRYTHVDSSDPMTQLVTTFVDRSGDAGFFNLVSAAGRAIYGKSSSEGLALAHFYFPAATYSTTPGKILLNQRQSAKVNTDSLQLTIKSDLGFADLTSYSSHTKDSTPYYGDLDATAVPAFNIFIGVKDTSWSQEFLLTSKPGSPLQWTAGLNYFQFKDIWDVDASFGNAPFIGFGGSGTTTKSIAAFLDATYEVTPQLFLTVGGRYSRDTVEDSYFLTNPFTSFYTGPTGNIIPLAVPAGTSIGVDDLKNSSFTPRLVVRYKPNDESSLYASFTKGYKAGILNVGGLSQQPVKPEKINAFEAGYKFDNRTVSVELAGFYYDYKNLQISSYQSGAAQIRNAASSEIYGAEAQFRFRVTSDFTITGGAAWTHARYKKFPNAPFYGYCDPTAAPLSVNWCVPVELGGGGPGSIVQGFVNASGFKMQRSPEFSGNLGASYTTELAGGRLTLSGNAYYTSSYYVDPEEQFKQGAYEVVSARAEWVDPSDHYSVAVFGDNLTNKRYQSQILFTTLGIGSVWNAPTTYGVEVGVKF